MEGLRGISLDGDALVIGAGTPHAEVAASALVQRHAPLVAQAAAVIGDRDDGRDVAGRRLQAAQDRGEAGPATDRDDPRAARERTMRPAT